MITVHPSCKNGLFNGVPEILAYPLSPVYGGKKTLLSQYRSQEELCDTVSLHFSWEVTIDRESYRLKPEPPSSKLYDYQFKNFFGKEKQVSNRRVDTYKRSGVTLFG